MNRELPPGFTLIGVDHKEVAINYWSVKDILEEIKPGFVTVEERLYCGFSFPLVIVTALRKELFTTPVDQLAILEQQLFAPDSNLLGGELVAAIIYCRRNNIPLHFIDLGKAPLEEVVSANILAVDPGKLLPKLPEDFSYSDEDRNAFMAKAINMLAKKHSKKKGVHIGGGGHYDRKRIKNPLQELIEITNVTIIDLIPPHPTYLERPDHF